MTTDETGETERWTSWTLARARPAMDLFLAVLRDTGNVRRSCAAASVPRSTVYYWRKRFATFRREWDVAMEDAVDILDAEAWRRAMEQDSDRLLMFLLKAHRRELYGDKQDIDVTTAGEPIKAYVVVSPDDWDEAE